jgi:ankyrin repeat protein
MAAGEGYVAVGTILLENGADVNLGFGGSRFTALHASAYRGSAEFAKLLLAHKANPNAIADGTTLLHLGAAQGSPELIEVLIAGGADVNARDKAGVTPLTLAHGNVQKGTADVLATHGAK